MSNTIEFTSEEKDSILKITSQYGELMRESVKLQEKIKDAEHQLRELANRMDELKHSENHFFFDLGAKYDMEPQTVQTQAANYVMSK
jgi:hypothetical protein